MADFTVKCSKSTVGCTRALFTAMGYKPVVKAHKGADTDVTIELADGAVLQYATNDKGVEALGLIVKCLAVTGYTPNMDAKDPGQHLSKACRDTIVKVADFTGSIDSYVLSTGALAKKVLHTTIPAVKYDATKVLMRKGASLPAVNASSDDTAIEISL